MVLTCWIHMRFYKSKYIYDRCFYFRLLEIELHNTVKFKFLNSIKMVV